MPGCNSQVPGLGDGSAAHDVGENTGNGITSGYKDNGPNTNVEVPAREDSEVENEDGAFGEAGSSAIEDSRNDVEL